MNLKKIATICKIFIFIKEKGQNSSLNGELESILTPQ
jgi:hypothetical protein